jgi:acetyl-CoA decarbonylase/synthase, CODH/ACS complex subunit gamma
MALTGMAVYKSLPKTNCGDCKFPTCMAFAMQVASKQKALTDCPHLSDKAKTEFSEASTPPMRLVHIGPEGAAGVDIGQETSLFRHEEKFQRRPALAAAVPASLTDEQAAARVDKINKAVFMRVGNEIAVRLAAVGLDGLTPEKAAARAAALAAKSRVPFILTGGSPEATAAAAKAIAAKKPLISMASGANAEAFIKIAAETKCPLAVSADTLEKLADLTTLAKEKGVADLVLAFDGRRPAAAIRQITAARRAGLKKNFRPLGYPAMVDVSTGDATKETALACTFVCKYASIIVLSGADASELLPILTTIQNIYTDPQVPNTVEAKLYEVGAVNENSPVLFTTNFALSYFSVEGEVERSKIPAYISVVDTEGLGVLNSYAGDKISPAKVVKALKDQKVAEKVKHRKLIIPGLLPAFRAEIEETSEWKEVMIGPEASNQIPRFLAEKWK